MSRARFGDEEVAVVSLPRDVREVPANLSAGEAEVYRAVVAGDSSAEIAAQRGTSVRTVENQVASILRKLGVVSRAELVAQRFQAP